MARTPWIADAKVAAMTGWAIFVLGALLLWDAYDGRGRNAPWPMSALCPF